MFVKTPLKGKRENEFKIPKMSLSTEEEIPDDVDPSDLLVFLWRLLESVTEMWSAMLGFGRDVEANFGLLRDDVKWLHIQSEAAHAQIGEEADLEQEFGTIWGALCKLHKVSEVDGVQKLENNVRNLAKNLERIRGVVAKASRRLHELTDGYGQVATRLLAVEDWVRKCELGHGSGVASRPRYSKDNGGAKQDKASSWGDDWLDPEESGDKKANPLGETG